MSETRKDTKPLCGFQDRCSPSEPYCGQTPCAYHEAVVREAEQTLRDHAPHLLATATPHTPDLAAVRTALVRVFDAAISESLDSARNVAALCEMFGLNYLDADSDYQLADALLAAVSRPAEAQEEPQWEQPTADELAMVQALAHNWAIDLNRVNPLMLSLHKKLTYRIAHPAQPETDE